MILVADSGATKIHWQGTRKRKTDTPFTLSTCGFNAMTGSEDELARVLKELKEALPEEKIEKICFYGAGCATQAICDKVKSCIVKEFPGVKTEVESDLLGAARALFGKHPGMVAILGTGSNTGWYKDGKIQKNIPSLGYVLGDEGSGASLGKRIAAAVARGLAPKEVAEAVGFGKDEILQRVYREPMPNKFLGEVVKRIQPLADHPYVSSLVNRELQSFFENVVNLYELPLNTSIGFVGSWAEFLAPRLVKMAKDYGCITGEILAAPIEKMTEYHEKYK